MKTTFLERKLQAIELLAQVENENLLSLIEQLLWDWAYLEVGKLSVETLEEELTEEDILAIWKERYEA